ncbi:uncharacterized protein J3R85_005800 [Psidium guajava]|nr:uncharacterized protein J3R85_005800 [Psidium guajava]
MSVSGQGMHQHHGKGKKGKRTCLQCFIPRSYTSSKPFITSDPLLSNTVYADMWSKALHTHLET